MAHGLQKPNCALGLSSSASEHLPCSLVCLYWKETPSGKRGAESRFSNLHEFSIFIGTSFENITALAVASKWKSKEELVSKQVQLLLNDKALEINIKFILRHKGSDLRENRCHISLATQKFAINLIKPFITPLTTLHFKLSQMPKCTCSILDRISFRFRNLPQGRDHASAMMISPR